MLGTHKEEPRAKIYAFNNSDDRKEDVFVSKLQSAISTQSVMGSKKPNCLIIDEIDGVEGREANTSIEFLIKLLTAKPKSAKKASKSEGENDKGSKNDKDSDEDKEEKEDDGEEGGTFFLILHLFVLLVLQ